ncbi:hypothetical protein SF123566_5631 [Shigella flexneri 1235-66]|nr:hypothetical protein SF123566_5631 [Shigella flexneri 1235-66]
MVCLYWRNGFLAQHYTGDVPALQGFNFRGGMVLILNWQP